MAGVRPHLLAALCLGLLVSPVRAEDDEVRSLELYNGADVETVSVSRSPRPASQTAENITVVTAKDIEAMNAHTLADVLFTVPGVQLEMLRTPGTVSFIDLQGSDFNHILVLIDNVPINNLADNFPDISSVPVQMIERIEIVKGAASSSWGNALGGVINVITKSPQNDRPVGGLASGSIGKRTTADARGELTGTLDRFGYYLTGGKLRSDGLQPNNWVGLNSFYGKLHYELPVRGSLTFTSFVTGGSSGETQFSTPPVNFNQDNTQFIATLSMLYPLSDSLTIEGLLRTRDFTSTVSGLTIADGSIVAQTKDDELTGGSSVKVSWNSDLQRVLVGLDYDYVRAHVTEPRKGADDLNNRANRVGIYLNDTFTIHRLAITPSARYDHTGIGGDLFSPSFGITYALTENSVLRGYTAKGYSLTSLNRNNSTEKVWTSQVGVETADLPYLWLKGTLYRNDTWNIMQLNDPTVKQSQLKEGFEIEARTMPVFGTSLSVGYTYTDARNSDTDEVIQGVARHTLDLGLKYEDSRYLRALLLGHYIDWNAPPSVGGKYHDIIWDLHLGKKFTYAEYGSVEVFLSLRNIFNGQQYLYNVYKNPGSWLEGGLKCAF